MDALRRIVRYLRISSRAAETETGASGAQLFVLERLAEGPAASISELAGRTLTDPSSVSVVVTRLVERGLVSRRASESDARRNEIALTAKGKAALRRAPELAQTRFLEAIERMPPAKTAALARSLEEFVDAVGAGEIAPRMLLEEETPPRRRAPKAPKTPKASPAKRR